MKKKLLAFFVTGLLMFAMLGSANAIPVEFQWTTTVKSVYGEFDDHGLTYPGEKITTYIIVDNGGSSNLSQSWSTDNFLSYRIEGESGWWIETSEISDNPLSNFTTDAFGNVDEVGYWELISGLFTTSFFPIVGDFMGSWQNTGSNELLRMNSPEGYIRVADVDENQKGSNWTAIIIDSPPAAPVPEPTTMLLFGIGLAGLAGTRRRKKQ